MALNDTISFDLQNSYYNHKCTSRDKLTSCNECALLQGFPYRVGQSFRIEQTCQTIQTNIFIILDSQFLGKAAGGGCAV